MPKFRKKPVVVEAVQFTGSNFREIQKLTGVPSFGSVDQGRFDDSGVTAQVFDRLHSTWVGVRPGQWIIRGVQGEFYPCAADVFAATYDVAEDE